MLRHGRKSISRETPLSNPPLPCALSYGLTLVVFRSLLPATYARSHGRRTKRYQRHSRAYTRHTGHEVDVPCRETAKPRCARARVNTIHTIYYHAVTALLFADADTVCTRDIPCYTHGGKS